MLPCSRCRRPADGGSPRRKGGSTRGPQERRLRHHGGINSGASTTAPLNAGGLFGNCACCVGMGLRHCQVPVCDGTVGNQEGGQGATATGEGTVGWRRSRILSLLGDAAQGDQWKSSVKGNNYGSGRALGIGRWRTDVDDQR